MNKNYGSLIVTGIIAVLLAVGISYVFLPKSISSLGSYVPPVQSAGGFSQSLATSTAYTLSCNPTNTQWLGTSALATGTLAAATTTFAACPNLNNLGTSVQGKIVNDSTNTVSYAGGTGDVFKCETTGVGTSTVTGTCTATGFTLLASSTVDLSYLFDSSSSSLVIDVGNNYK